MGAGDLSGLGGTTIEAMPLKLYNTLSKQIETFRPRDAARVTFYTCGPTVYDDAHIGNFRSFLAADVLRRWLESSWCEVETEGGLHAGPRRVVHVMNITDVGHMTDDGDGVDGAEDKMAVAGRRLAEAKKAGKLPAGVELDERDATAVARFYEARFRDDARRLGLKVAIEAERDSTLMPRATEHVVGMIAVVEKLIARGYAYVVGSPGARAVYFRVRALPGYGKLSGNTLDKLREGEGGRVSGANQAGKDHPADFLLWKEDAAHIMKWPSPWGTGYPGWHIECTVMSATRLALGNGAPEKSGAEERGGLVALDVPGGEAIIDLHSGGEDNIFPHHECEIAQTCAAFNRTPEAGTYARHWFHPRFLFVNGAKMSKSKGTFYTLRDLLGQGLGAGAVRLELIRAHYRSNANFTEQGLKDSTRMLERWRKVAEGSGPGHPRNSLLRETCRREFVEAMQNDLNTAAAVAAVNSFVGAIDSPGEEDAALLREIDNVMGVLALERPAEVRTDIAVFGPGVTPDETVVAMLEARKAARAAKDFAASDRIRDDLLAMGYEIKDVAGGRVEVRRR